VLASKLTLHRTHLVVDPLEWGVRVLLGNAVWRIDERRGEFQRRGRYFTRPEHSESPTSFLAEHGPTVATLHDADAKRTECTVDHASFARHHESGFHSPHSVDEGHGLVRGDLSGPDRGPRRSCDLNRNIDNGGVLGVGLKLRRRFGAVLDRPRVDSDVEAAEGATRRSWCLSHSGRTILQLKW
jgi:hypothetical protein